MADFLLEIGTEEIPSWMVKGLYAEMAEKLERAVEAERLSFGAVQSGGTPRRLHLHILGLPERQEDWVEEVKGPPLPIARDDSGNWTKAALGFARKQEADVSELKIMEGLKGPCVGFERRMEGKRTAEILAKLVPESVDSLYLPKTMRWGRGEFQFVRPVRWVVALLDGDVVPMVIKGIPSGRESRGHRIHGFSSVEIPHAGAYRGLMEEQYVISDPEERRGRIEAQLTAAAASVEGAWDEGSPETESLLNTVACLSEYPTVLLGGIPEEYTSLPPEILSTCLREHQHCFAVYGGGGADGAVRPHFLAVIDGPGDPKGKIRTGNENVIVSRLADARFFYENDVEIPLEDRLEELRGIVFHPKIGSYAEKAERLERYARELAPAWKVDPEQAARAARLCKCDLASLLVEEKEFTSLQGIAGGLYARAQGEAPEVAEAIGRHYDPLLDEGSSPEEISEGRVLGGVVALADRLDTLLEIFRVGLIPSGSKDPFALRRAATHVIHLLEGTGFVSRDRRPEIDLGMLVNRWFGEGGDTLLDFLKERLRYKWERDLPSASAGQGGTHERFGYDEINAVFASGLGILADMRDRLEALHAVRREFPEDFDALSAAFKRSRNILKGVPAYELDPNRFLPDSNPEGAGERALYAAYEDMRSEASGLLEEKAYADALRVLARVRPAVDQFYDDVLVMCDPEGKDPEKTALQRNRLALLQRLVALFDRIADFSEIVPREN